MGVFGKLHAAVVGMAFGASPKTLKTSFYQLADTLIDGTPITMKRYQGDVLCVVNVASKWGLTKRDYTQLVSLVDTYGKDGFKVLAFPCNQFLKQEPGTEEEILKFVDENFNGASKKLEFFKKGDVNGPNTREVFSFLKYAMPYEDGSTDVLWNFEKFLIDHEGKPIERFGSKTEPNKMKDTLEKLLAKRNGSETQSK